LMRGDDAGSKDLEFGTGTHPPNNPPTSARIGRVRGCARAESRALGLGYTQRGREARGSGCEGRGRGWSGRGGPVDAVSGLPAAGSGGSEGANGRKR